VAHALPEDLTLAPTLPTKAAHGLLEVLLEGTGLGRQRRGSGGALLQDGLDEGEDFFGALYSVVASVTRWLPCADGKVAMRRGAGLTRPSSIAAAAWMATNSSLRASSRRLRNGARVSGKPKGSCGLSRCTASRPQAYMTATSVRNRSQMASSDAPPSCLSSSSASKPRVGIGGRPPWARLGKRRATLYSMASTKLGPGQCIGPLADGIGVGDDIGNLEPEAAPAQPMLQVTEQTHRESSCWMRSGCPRIRRYVPHDNPLATRRWKISNH
jgi:hypothetical protein